MRVAERLCGRPAHSGWRWLPLTFGVIAADQIFKAIGQTFEASGLGALYMEAGRIAIDEEGRTSLDGVWAGGDCVLGGDDLTVSAVAQGRDAAESINVALAAALAPASAVA